MYWSYPILPFGIVACTVFPTTFLEIAVYGLQKLNGAIGLHYDKESIDRSKPGNVLPFCHSLKSELLMKLLPTCTGIIAVIKPPVTWEKFDLPGLQILSCDLTAPKLSTNDEWQLSIHTLGWERKYTQKERKRKKVKAVFWMSQIMSSYINRVKTTSFKWTSHISWHYEPLHWIKKGSRRREKTSRVVKNVVEEERRLLLSKK